jgi:hypothetical protein
MRFIGSLVEAVVSLIEIFGVIRDSRGVMTEGMGYWRNKRRRERAERED